MNCYVLVLEGEPVGEEDRNKSHSDSGITIVAVSGTFFKVMPFAPGVEFALNLVNQMLMNGEAAITSSSAAAVSPHTPSSSSSSASSTPQSRHVSSAEPSRPYPSSILVSPMTNTHMSTMETPIQSSSLAALPSRNISSSPPAVSKSQKAFTPANPSHPKYQKVFSSQPFSAPSSASQQPQRVGSQQEIGKVIDYQSKSDFTQENICRLILSSKVVKRRRINFIKVVDTTNRPSSGLVKPKAMFYEWSPYLTIENLNDVTVSEKFIRQVKLKSFSATFLTCLIADVTQVKLFQILFLIITAISAKSNIYHYL